jgi:hypothetical protein
VVILIQACVTLQIQGVRHAEVFDNFITSSLDFSLCTNKRG